MRVLVVCPHFEPDAAPTGVVISEIVHRVADLGHEIEVVTSLPWYEHHAVEPEWRGRPVQRERTPWGRISRVHPFPTDKRNIPARALGFAGFTGLAALVATFQRRRPDVVLTMSPPLTLGLAGWLAARIRRAPFVFNVQDVFPDVAVDVGAITDKRVIAVARWLERFTYRRSDAVTVLSDDLRHNLAAKIGADRADRVRVVPNFVDTDRIRPATGRSYRDEFGLGDRTVVMYAGNVGFSQPLDLVVEAARRHRDRDDLVFVINGGGSARADLQASAADLDNIVFVDFQPSDRLPEVLAAADVHVIALRRGLARSSVPSKLYSILAAGRPVVAAIDPGTEVARILESTGAGVAVAPEDPDDFVAGLDRVLADDAEREAMGCRGREFVEQWVSPTGVAETYVELFEDLVARRS